MSDTQVRPRLPLPVPVGYQAPSTPGGNPDVATIDTLNNVKPRATEDPQQPYARRDEDNDFGGHSQFSMVLAGDGTPYQLVTASGTELDIATYGWFIIRSVGGSDFTVSLPTPTIDYDPETGDPIRVARAVVVEVEYTGSGKPVFSGATLPDGGDEPDWSSTAGQMDRVILAWADRWTVNVGNLGFAI